MTPCQRDFYAEVSADFSIAREYHFEALISTLDDGRFIVITDINGCGLPTLDNWQACVYDCEDDFHAAEGDLMSVSVADFDDDIDTALEILTADGVRS